MDLHVLRLQAGSPKMWFLKNVARTLYSVFCGCDGVWGCK